MSVAILTLIDFWIAIHIRSIKNALTASEAKLCPMVSAERASPNRIATSDNSLFPRTSSETSSNPL